MQAQVKAIDCLMLQLGVSGNLDLGRFCRAVKATFSRTNKQGSSKWGGRRTYLCRS